MSTSGSVGLKRGFRGLERGLIELACVNHTRNPIRAAELDVVISTSSLARAQDFPDYKVFFTIDFLVKDFFARSQDF